MNKLDWPGKMSWFTLVLVDDTVQVFFFAPLLRSSWRWWQSWMNDVFVHQSYAQKEEGIPSNTKKQQKPPQQTN